MARPVGRPKSMNTLMAPAKSNTSFSEGYKSKGMLDDFAVRKNIDTSAGTIQKTPVNCKDIVNKEYVDSISINTGIDLFAYDSASDTGAYKQFKLNPSVDAEVEGMVEIAANATAQMVGARITEVGINVQALLNTLTSGIYNFHVHLKAEKISRLKLYAEIYVRAAGGTETLITTTEPTGFIGITKAGYDTHATVTTDYPLTAGDRIVLKAYATNVSAVATDLYIYVEGNTATRVSLRGLTSPTSVEGTSVLSTGEEGGTKFLREDGDGTCSWQAAGGGGVDWTLDQSPLVIHAANYVDNDTTYVSSDFIHDDLTGFVANEHIDWTADQGATNIHANNYTDTNTTAHASFSQLDYASAGHTGFAPALGADDNYVTDAQLAALHAQSHTIVSHSDTTATGAELNTLTDGSETTLHSHAGGTGGTTYWSCPGLHFKADGGGDSTTVQSANGVIECAGFMIAAVFLPHGATITGAIVWGLDTNETWVLYRSALSGAAAGTSLANAIFSTEDTSINSAVVDNQTYRYWFETSFLTSTDDIYGGRITYTT